MAGVNATATRSACDLAAVAPSKPELSWLDIWQWLFSVTTGDTAAKLLWHRLHWHWWQNRCRSLFVLWYLCERRTRHCLKVQPIHPYVTILFMVRFLQNVETKVHQTRKISNSQAFLTEGVNSQYGTYITCCTHYKGLCYAEGVRQSCRMDRT